MLTALRLGNFKAFGETQTIPLRPLTLIFGPNSSGKSSIIHGLLFAHEANRTGNLDVQRTQLGGDAVDLGGYRQFVHRCGGYRQFVRDCRTVEFGLERDISDLPGGLAEALAPSVTLSANATFDVESSGLALTSYCVDLDGRMLLGAKLIAREARGEYLTRADGDYTVAELSPEPEGTDPVGWARRQARWLGFARSTNKELVLFRLQHAHPALQATLRSQHSRSARATTQTEKRRNVGNDVIADIMRQITLRQGVLWPTGVIDSAQVKPGLPGGAARVRSTRLFLHLRSNLLRFLDGLLREIATLATEDLNRLVYLGPLRSYPPRHLAFDQHHDPNWQAGGGQAYDIARRDGKVREEINKWLGDEQKLRTPYELCTARLWPLHRLRERVEIMADQFFGREIAGEWSREQFEEELGSILDFADTLADDDEVEVGVDSSLPELMWLVDKRTNTSVTHRDVGIGISQVLPVLTVAFASRNRIVAIEQPEIHLHPALQAELADVFIGSALGERKNRFVVETHSEHLILRVMRRMRETFERRLPEGIPPLRPSDVAVLYVEPTPNGSIVREMPLNERGELVKAWPGGFFEEGLREVLP